MTIFDFITKFILFVIPGFITVSVFCYLTGQKPQTNVYYIAYVFAASSISFLLSDLILLLINVMFKARIVLVNVAEILKGAGTKISNTNMSVTLLVSVILSFVFVRAWDDRLLFKVANKMRVTHRLDNCAVWDYMFEKQSWVVLRDYITENTYFGRVEKYSDLRETYEILLEEVHVWSKKDGEYCMEQVYLSRSPSEFSIEIDNYKKGENENVKTIAATAGQA